MDSILQAQILEWVAVPFSVESRCPALQVDSLPGEPQGKLRSGYSICLFLSDLLPAVCWSLGPSVLLRMA